MKAPRDLFKPRHETLLRRVNNPNFALVDWTGTNIDDAFEFGREAGYAACAKEVHDALAGSPEGGAVETAEISEDLPRPGSGGLAGYRR